MTAAAAEVAEAIGAWACMTVACLVLIVAIGAVDCARTLRLREKGREP